MLTKIFKYKFIASFILLSLFLIMGVANANGSLVVQKSILQGEVVATQLVAVGQQVKEGEALVCVKTALGTAVASRATVNGTVVEVLVRPGEIVKTQQAVVVLKN